MKINVWILLVVFGLCWAANSASSQQNSPSDGLFEVKLVGGQTARDGVVMVRDQAGVWGTICQKEFHRDEANAVCKYLGHHGGSPLCCQPYGYVEWGRHALTAVHCHTNASLTDDCHLHWHNMSQSAQELMDSMHLDTPSDCPATTDYAAVVCHPGPAPPPTDFKLRVSGQSNFTGKLKVTYDGIEGNICADGWDKEDADLACRQLGFQHGINSTGGLRDSLVSLHTHGPMWTSNIACNEKVDRTFADCPKTPFGSVSKCSNPHAFAAVICYDDGLTHMTGNLAMRLSGDSGREYQGRLEVLLDGQWGSVELNDAWYYTTVSQVVCMSLGYVGGHLDISDLYTSSLTPPDTHTVWTSEFRCDGHEPDLTHCKMDTEWRRTSRRFHGQDVLIHCQLVDVEVRYGHWYNYGMVMMSTPHRDHTDVTHLPVCRSTFNEADAVVVCRQLGYETGFPLCCGRTFRTKREEVPDLGYDRIDLRSTCGPDNWSASECMDTRHVTASCPGNDDASVYCYDPAMSEEGEADTYVLWISFNDVFYNTIIDYYQLTDYYQQTDNYDHMELHGQTWGALSVLYRGVAGRVCSDGWDSQDAGVACKELGFTNGQAYNHSSSNHNDYSANIIWSSNFQCTGNESALSACKHDGWGKTNVCHSNSHAGVFCYNEDGGVKYQVHFVNSTSDQGRLELLFPGLQEWATLCADYRDPHLPSVACRMFGYSGGHFWDASSGDHFATSGPVFQRRESCVGNELHIDQCQHDGFVPAYSDHCKDHHSDIGVQCYHRAETTPRKDTHQATLHNVTSHVTPTDQTSSNVGGVVGGVVGAVVLLAVAVVAVLLIWRRRQKGVTSTVEQPSFGYGVQKDDVVSRY